MIDRDAAHEKMQTLEYVITDMGGLIQALTTCIDHHSALSNNAAETRAIRCLIREIEAKSEHAEDVHRAAWDTVFNFLT